MVSQYRLLNKVRVVVVAEFVYSVYSEDAAGEAEIVCVSDSPKNYIPVKNNGKRSLLA